MDDGGGGGGGYGGGDGGGGNNNNQSLSRVRLHVWMCLLTFCVILLGCSLGLIFVLFYQC